MRIFSLLTAALVMAGLYLIVFERQAVLRFARGEAAIEVSPQPRTQPAAADTTAEDADNSPDAPPASGPASAPASLPAAESPAAESPAPVSVVALRSRARDIDSAVILRGRTEASRQVDVRSEITGLVMSAPRPKGSVVAAGDLLCELDPGTRIAERDEARARVPEMEARLAEAQARLEEAQINDRAASRLSQDGFASTTRVAATAAALESARAGVQAARAGLQSAQAGVAAASKQIERLQLKAPFAGLLESDTAELGSFLQPGSLCATVIQIDPIKLVGFAPEADIDRVTLGAPAQARLVSGDTVEGQVTFVSRSADETTRTFRVDVDVANPEGAISDGQTAEIVIASDGRRAHLLPQSALTLNDAGVIGVRSVDAESTARFLPAEVLRDTPQGVWIGGLPDAVDVIVVGQEYVIDGVPVAPHWRGDDATRPEPEG
ncbi:efflux RND transporter periplasmic adaptor subunit [Brevirhabdus sp.]|uniref:efflux RND transporter periplasmic adaptor subunit n=1 Tax=Brevirhabdus sp. TaxID=2004514 RepID=UPI004057F54C